MNLSGLPTNLNFKILIENVGYYSEAQQFRTKIFKLQQKSFSGKIFSIFSIFNYTKHKGSSLYKSRHVAVLDTERELF